MNPSLKRIYLCQLQKGEMTRAGFFLVAILVACAPGVANYETIRVTTDSAVPAKCAFLAEVAGGAETLSSTGATSVGASVPHDPIVSLKQATADLGGDTVVIVSSGDSGIGASILGEAYACRGYNPQ